MADNEIVYTIKVDDKGANKAVKDLDKGAADSGGASGGFGKLGKSISSIGPMAIAAASAIATYFVAQGLRAGIAAAIEQENAINAMNNALSRTGRLTQETSQDMQRFASEIQRVTTVGDEAALSYLALATNFTKSNEQSKQLVKAAIDLSHAMGISVDQAVRSLGGTLTGQIGLLGRSVGAVKGLTEAQLRSGEAIDIVSRKFAGAGAAAANTYQGRLKQLKNTFGDFTEEIGFFFTKSDALRKSFAFLASEVRRLTERFSFFRNESGDVFKPILLGAADTSIFFVEVFGPAIEFLINMFKRLITQMGNVATLWKQIFTKDLIGAVETFGKLLVEEVNYKDLFNLSGTESALEFLHGFKNSVVTSSGIVSDAINEALNAAGGKPDLGPDDPEKVLESLDLITFAYANFFDKTNDKMQSFEKNQAALKENLKKGLFATMVNGVSRSMNAVGAALAKGEDALGAFSKAIFGMFGEMANMLGQHYFLLGIAAFPTNPASGSAMIAGGLALMAFGGILSAMGGGGGGATSSGASSNAGGGGSAMSAEIGDDRNGLADQERQRVTDVSVIVQGNVIGDKRTFGKEIAEALNDAFGNDGIIVARGAIA